MAWKEMFPRCSAVRLAFIYHIRNHLLSLPFTEIKKKKKRKGGSFHCKLKILLFLCSGDDHEARAHSDYHHTRIHLIIRRPSISHLSLLHQRL
ncbi:hypothetical protein SCA6_002010 [Theobroma cacao]